MQRRYEILVLTVPEITQDESKNLEVQLDRVIQSAKGVTISFERWGKYKLPYQVKKNDYGVYFLHRFEAPQGTNIIESLKALCAVKLNDIVMRFMVSLLDSKQSLVYQRPPSLEEAPTGKEVGTFFKENKVGDLGVNEEASEAIEA